MATSLLDLPVEIRLEIYSSVFREGKVVLDAGNYGGGSYLVPKHAVPVNSVGRSSQLLRTCKSILHEARPVLYDNTTVHVTTSTFAGNLPTSLTDGSPLARYARKLVWQLQCDLMKTFYFDDFAVTEADVANLDCLEIRCRAENWRDSFCGDVCDRQAFLHGREQMIQYGKSLVELADKAGYRTALIEDRKLLGKGEVRMRLSRGSGILDAEELLIS